MHVLDRYDLEPGYSGDCPLCGEGIYDDQETATVARETVHKACKQLLDEEMMYEWAHDMEYEQRGNE